MSLVIETDLGHDPDDFFAICYLIAAGVKVDAITIVPGDLDQVAIAKFLTRELGLDIPIGVSDVRRDKYSSGSIHTELLKRYGLPKSAQHDGDGCSVISSISNEFDVLVIGPPKNIGRYLATNPTKRIPRLVMQGGFVPYSRHRPRMTLPQFEGMSSYPTFNMNGDRGGTDNIIHSPIIHKKYFAGKNVCHTVLFNQINLQTFSPPRNRAGELFHEAANILLNKVVEKKLHDPTAACCYMHPHIGEWMRGVPRRAGAGWTTFDTIEDSFALIDLKRDEFWSYLSELT